ncbi:hypothetical protein J6590_018202 [Homalodisca vitripennis]|nr:hypothetical protein J6590_018202 [Homalodisca vitripennis]
MIAPVVDREGPTGNGISLLLEKEDLGIHQVTVRMVTNQGQCESRLTVYTQEAMMVVGRTGRRKEPQEVSSSSNTM